MVETCTLTNKEGMQVWRRIATDSTDLFTNAPSQSNINRTAAVQGFNLLSYAIIMTQNELRDLNKAAQNAYESDKALAEVAISPEITLMPPLDRALEKTRRLVCECEPSFLEEVGRFSPMAQFQLDHKNKLCPTQESPSAGVGLS